MKFNPGFDIVPTTNPMGFVYGKDVFGPWRIVFSVIYGRVWPILIVTVLKSYIL